MTAVIRKRVTVDQRGAVVLVDARLQPGEEVEVIVRPLEKRGTGSFLNTARSVSIDAPGNYSVGYGQDKSMNRDQVIGPLRAYEPDLRGPDF